MKNMILDKLIREGVAVICHSPEEVMELSEMVESLLPGRGNCVASYVNSFNHPDCSGEIAIRLEVYFDNSFDYGWDFPSYYKRVGRRLVNLSELYCDFGEFNVNAGNVCDLLFGG
jgi:hypothetical protein